MQKNRGSRISNEPGRKRLGVKRSQVQVLSPRLVGRAYNSGVLDTHRRSVVPPGIQSYPVN